MRKVALTVAALFVLAVVSPAFSQPFADVPTDHWAFDAIAELAAKGLVEGYPDGTFKGDRAMTRYEMAMVVARILARVEAIKIPPPPPPVKIPPPEVTRADIQTLQRLINEFRAELAALGVRVTAVEEELAALRARLDNTRVTGDVRFRYNAFPVGSVSGSGTGRAPDARMRARLTFTGQVAQGVSATTRLWLANNAGTASNFDVRFGNTSVFNSVSFDLLYLDITTPFLFPIQWRIGRQFLALGGIPNWGLGYGLLFDEANVGAVTGVTDAIRAQTTIGPLSLFAFAAQENEADAVSGVGTVGGAASPGASGLGSAPRLNFYGVRGSFGIMPGWTLGASFLTERNPFAGGGGGTSYTGATIPTATTRGNGWSFDIGGNLMPGVGFYADYAAWTFSGMSSGNAWRAGVSLNLGQIAGITQFSPVLDLWYKSFGPLPGGAATRPAYTGACDEILFTLTDCWNMRGWGTNLSMTFSPRLNGAVTYEGYTRLSTGAAASAWWARLNYTLATRTTLSTQYFRQTVGGADASNFYRIQLTYSW